MNLSGVIDYIFLSDAEDMTQDLYKYMAKGIVDRINEWKKYYQEIKKGIKERRMEMRRLVIFDGNVQMPDVDTEETTSEKLNIIFDVNNNPYPYAMELPWLLPTYLFTMTGARLGRSIITICDITSSRPRGNQITVTLNCILWCSIEPVNTHALVKKYLDRHKQTIVNRIKGLAKESIIYSNVWTIRTALHSDRSNANNDANIQIEIVGINKKLEE